MEDESVALIRRLSRDPAEVKAILDRFQRVAAHFNSLADRCSCRLAPTKRITPSCDAFQTERCADRRQGSRALQIGDLTELGLMGDRRCASLAGGPSNDR